MRDLETIEAAIRAAETGHLVFGTLHTTGAAGTIDRLIDAFPVQQPAGPDPGAALGTPHRVLSQALLTRVDKPGMVACLRVPGRDAGHRNLIRENKTFRIDSDDPDRQEVRHAAAG